MKQQSTFREAQVLFTKNHSMTKITIKLCIHLIKLVFSNKMNIGLILDKSIMYDCQSLLKYTKSNNNIPLFIHISFVTKNLTSVYSLPNIIVIKDLKANIRRKYECLLSSMRKKRGDKVNMTKEHVVSIVTSSFEDINTINEGDQRIRQEFDVCKLNPYFEDTIIFERHLALVSEKNIQGSD